MGIGEMQVERRALHGPGDAKAGCLRAQTCVSRASRLLTYRPDLSGKHESDGAIEGNGLN